MAEAQVPIDDAVVLRWLSWSLAKELDAEALKVYQGGGATPLFSYLSRYPALSATLERLERAIDSWSDLEDPELDLAADFATIFLGSGDAGAPLYASCYTPPGHLFGPPHERMLKRLEATGLVASTLAEEPADHLGVMLDYLAHSQAAPDLIPTAAHAFDDPVTFIRDELLTWLPELQARAERVKTASDTHKALTALTLELLQVLAKKAPAAAVVS